MWFAISPLMPTLKKPKCEAPDSDVCKACALKFPKDNMKFYGDNEKDLFALKGAKDAKCKVCYPYEGRAKGRAGCGGLGLTDKEVKVQLYNVYDISSLTKASSHNIYHHSPKLSSHSSHSLGWQYRLAPSSAFQAPSSSASFWVP